MDEEWRPVVGWEAHYEVSSLGRVRSCPRSFIRRGDGARYTWPGKILKTLPENGWPVISLASDGGANFERLRVAYIVIAAFTDWDMASGVVEFRNGDLLDLRVSNMKFVPVTDPGEVWRPVVGYEGAYEASNLGRVRSCARTVFYIRNGAKILRRHRPRILRPSLTGGYPNLGLRAEGVSRRAFVHGLVCEAFHGPRPVGHDVCHRDGNRLNASADNLYWGTRRQNERDKYVQQFAQMAGISLEYAWSMIDRARTPPPAAAPQN